MTDDPPDSRARCFSSVQCVRTAQSRDTLLGATAPVGASASRRFPLAARSGALVWELGQGRQPLLWAHRQCLRLGARPLEMGFGCGWRQITLVSPDGHLSQRYHFGHGSFSESLSSLTPHPILAAPFVEPPSLNPTDSPLRAGGRGRTYRVCHHHVPGHCQILMDMRSPQEQTCE